MQGYLSIIIAVKVKTNSRHRGSRTVNAAHSFHIHQQSWVQFTVKACVKKIVTGWSQILICALRSTQVRCVRLKGTETAGDRQHGVSSQDHILLMVQVWEPTAKQTWGQVERITWSQIFAVKLNLRTRGWNYLKCHIYHFIVVGLHWPTLSWHILRSLPEMMSTPHAFRRQTLFFTRINKNLNILTLTYLQQQKKWKFILNVLVQSNCF